MASDLNNICVSGRLTRDPESFTAGKSIGVNLALACNRDYVREGEPEVDYLDVVAFGQPAEYAAQYFKKGDYTLVTGRLRIEEFVGQDQVKRKKPVIKAQSLQAGPKSTGAPSSGSGPAKSSEGDTDYFAEPSEARAPARPAAPKGTGGRAYVPPVNLSDGDESDPYS